MQDNLIKLYDILLLLTDVKILSDVKNKHIIN